LNDSNTAAIMRSGIAKAGCCCTVGHVAACDGGKLLLMLYITHYADLLLKMDYKF